MHIHISALSAVITALEVIVVLGVLNLLAMKYADQSPLAASYCNLFGLDH